MAALFGKEKKRNEGCGFRRRGGMKMVNQMNIP